VCAHAILQAGRWTRAYAGTGAASRGSTCIGACAGASASTDSGAGAFAGTSAGVSTGTGTDVGADSSASASAASAHDRAVAGFYGCDFVAPDGAS